MTDSDFEKEVTIRLRERMKLDWQTRNDGTRASQLKSLASLEVWEPKKRKPSAILTADSRGQVLRDLADWIEANDDPTLAKFVAEYKERIGQ